MRLFFLPILFVCIIRASAAEPIPSITQRVPPKNKFSQFGCKREYLYQGQAHPVDSIHRKDGEGLRSVMSAVPSALDHLEIYQKNRRTFQRGAYIGTAGIGLMLLGELAKKLAPGPTGNSLAQIGLFSGIGMLAGGLTYSFLVLQNNEAHLGLAVKQYNSERQNDHIDLQFETGISF